MSKPQQCLSPRQGRALTGFSQWDSVGSEQDCKAGTGSTVSTCHAGIRDMPGGQCLAGKQSEALASLYQVPADCALGTCGKPRIALHSTQDRHAACPGAQLTLRVSTFSRLVVRMRGWVSGLPLMASSSAEEGKTPMVEPSEPKDRLLALGGRPRRDLRMPEPAGHRDYTGNSRQGSPQSPASGCC